MTGVGALMVLAAAAWIIAAPDPGTLLVSRGAAGAVAAAGKAAAQQLRSDLGSSSSSTGPSWLTTTRTGRALGRLGRLVRGGARAARVTGRALAAGATAAPQGWSQGMERAAGRRNSYGWPSDLVRGRFGSAAPAAATPSAPEERTGPTERPDPAPRPGPGEEPGPAGVDREEPAAAGGPLPGPVQADPAGRDEAGPGPFEARWVRLPDGQDRTVQVDTGPPRSRFEQLLSPEGLARLRLLTAIRDAGYTGWLDRDVQPVSGPVLAPAPADPVLAVVDNHGDVLWQRRAVCPECGEPVQPVPPLQWPAGNGPRPGWSHLDGEPLCPVIGEKGYVPAEPEAADPSEPGLPGGVGGLGWADLPGTGPLRLVPSNSPASAGVNTTHPIQNDQKEHEPMPTSTSTRTESAGDVQPISRGDLETIDDLDVELADAGNVADVANAYLAALAEWATSLADRYASASFRTAGLSRAVSELLEAIPNPNTVSSLEDAIAGVRHEIGQAEALSEAAETLDAEGDLSAFRRA